MKTSKRAKLSVVYTRINAKEHAQISKIARRRGHPHTLASVAAELISAALRMQASEPPPPTPDKERSR